VSFPARPKAALKVGATWSTEEAFPHLCLPSLPYRYEVAASEIVNGQVCWRIEKRLADPLPRVAPWAYNKKITVRNLTERFWITQKPPLRLWQYEYESDLATSTPDGDGEYRTRQQVQLTLEKARTLSREELAGRKRQFTGLFDLQNRFQKVRSVPIVRWPQENPTEALRQIAASLGAWTRAYPRSSYQPAGDALRQGVEQHQQEYNHQMKR
jgi:hypothetical protein